jgi:hypothetical protein
MRSRVLIAIFGGLLLAFGLFVARAQDPDDEQVRGAFLSSRPKTTANTSSRRRKPPRRTSTANSNSSGSASGSASNANSGGSSKPNAQPAAIGLGYTLFMRDADGNALRVDPTSEFRNGDQIRVAMEPNIDGYVYIFHSENDGQPEMIYPDQRLESGDNAIEAHVPFEVPSSEETNESLRWFKFYGNGGTERLYVVVTREPLKSVPAGDDLVAFCAANKDKCPWHASPEAWAQVQEAMKADVKVVSTKNYGQSQTSKEKTATTRGLGLDQSAPQPSVIRMNASTNAPVLVTVLDLVHK